MTRQIQQFKLQHNEARERALNAVKFAPMGFIVEVKEPSRTLDQNAAQWPILEAFARQLEWPVNGRMEKLSREEWKDLLTAAFRQETTRIAMGLNGGVVLLGMRTSQMSKAKFSEWLDFLHHVATERGVQIEPPSQRENL
jgi:hypothetical protein